ncbi:hypothetical protein [Bradyrhizobium sp. STM 3566]|uniref:hypothetical protein n=1 Tax=Bradyrhizobium sp. STM 3566 TaxID=578928 RepID=UPI00388DFE15
MAKKARAVKRAPHGRKKRSSPAKAKKGRSSKETSGRKSGKAQTSTTPASLSSKVSHARKSTTSQNHTPTVGGGTISVRMYRGLLGDFFFIRHTVGAKSFKMLIDCGVLQRIGTEKAKPSTSLGKQRIVAGARDFIQECAGSVDLIVATHEHYDHLSGFMLANDSFANFKIGKVWMAWTEDRRDRLANSYRNKKNKALAALALLADNPSLSAAEAMETVRNLLQFYGNVTGPGIAAAGRTGAARLSGNSSCEAVLEWLRQKAGMANVSFLKPGDVVRWGVDDIFRAYVLGPPRDDQRLRQLDPSKGSAREVYLARGEDVESLTGLAAIHTERERDWHLDDLPFAPLHWRSYDLDGTTRGPKSKKLDDPIVKLYERTDDISRDRRIDADWLGSAENLALKIDGDVNNTSLALALELADKRVFLFPGDAQVGNWLSWGDQTYSAEDKKDGPKLKIDELLSRTILYKVGHHASHNATLRNQGLELMTNPDLCAMIPVVEKTAREQKTKSSPDGWAMPYGDLYKRLEQRTAGRIVRGDGDISEEKRKFGKSIFGLSYGDTLKPKDPLWVELSLKI